MTTEKTTAEEVREAETRIAADNLAHRLDAVATATGHAEKDPPLAAEGMEDQDLAEAIALLQDVRARLLNVERDLAATLGKRRGKTVGQLADGRQFKLERATERKEWDHDEWKRDARRAIVENVQETFTVSGEEGLVNMATGEEHTLGQVLQIAVTQAQEVHGSTSPRSTKLKELGLYASDYCTSTPSGWRFSAIKPTTKEDTTDA